MFYNHILRLLFPFLRPFNAVAAERLGLPIPVHVLSSAVYVCVVKGPHHNTKHMQ